MANSVPKDRILSRLAALKSERASFLSTWQDISTYLLPYQGRYFTQDRNKGQRRTNKIYDSTATRALRILGAGMMAGATSPARPWFRLMTPDPELNDHMPVKVWLADTTRLMERVFTKSNTYRALHQIYEELGAFGTAASIVEDDFDTIIHHHTQTAGQYSIATDYKGRVCTIYREFELPVSQMVKEFGRENCSVSVRNLYDRGSLDTWVPVIHAIEPRADRDIRKQDARNMPWASYYFELDATDGKFLRESGFPMFPAVCPRWAVAGGDIYGNGPGNEAMGDIKQLQHEQLRKAQGIDYQTNPPLQVPNSKKGSEVDRLPGGISYYDANSPQGGIKSLFDVRLDLEHLTMDIQDVRSRINSAFYADLFLMLANNTQLQKTATEVAELHEEKMLVLGPVLERIHNELLNPKIDITFSRLVKSGVLPPPPEDLRGMELNVEFVSMLAQAQKAIGVNSVDRWVGSLGQVAAFKPDVIDKFDSDRWAEAYADMLGVDPSLIVADDKVAIVRQDRAKQAAQAQQAAMAEQQSKTARNLAASPMNNDNALTNVMGMFSGYNTP